MPNNLATTKMIQNIIDGTTPPQRAIKASQDGSGNNIENSYAKQNGTYVNMTVGNANNADAAAEAIKATQDSNGDNIVNTYAKQSGNYPNMDVGEATHADSADNAARATRVSHSLTFGSKTFDGSANQTITREDLGIGTIYTLAGSVAFADLPTPSAANVGYIYNVTDDFTTDSRFVEGAGIHCAAGTNVGIVRQDAVYMFDVFGTDIDTSNFAEVDGNYPNMSVGEAEKVSNTLTLVIDGSTITFDGSTAQSATINTSGAVHIDVVDITIPTSSWSNRAVTLTAADYPVIANVTATTTVQLIASDNSAATFITNNVNLASQGVGNVTLNCTTTPTSSISATLMIIN